MSLGKRSFEIPVDGGMLTDLQARLRHPRFAPPLAGSDGWNHGPDPAWFRGLIDHWRSGFDWPAQVAALNRFQHFKVQLGGADLHFVHERSARPNATPLLLLHGWPDSFFRYTKVIRPLTEAGFDVVVPSLPGFGFTGPVQWPTPRQPTRQAAQLLHRLMTETLGYPQFGVSGGDGGSPIAQLIAIDRPQSVIGVHLTDLGWQAQNFDHATATAEEKKYLAAAGKAFWSDGAYAMVHTTRPRSLTASLNDSPIGLAAWIVDRFHAWVDHRGDLEKLVSKDELLTQVMIYWVTQTIGPSVFAYHADQRSPSLTPNDRVERPVGLSLFPKDIGGVPPRHLAERTLNVARWSELEVGGHFPAFEQPRIFTDEVVDFFTSLGALDPIRPTGGAGEHATV